MKKSIKKKLSISYAILIILSAVFLNAFHFYQVYEYTSRQNKIEIEREFQQTLNVINSIFSQLNVIQMQAVDVILDNSEHGGNIDGSIKKYQLDNCKNIEKEFLSLRRSCPYIADITWIEDGGMVCSTNGNLRYNKYRDNQSIRQLKEGKKDSLFIGTYNRKEYLINGHDEYVFSYVKNIYDIYNIKNKKGILQIDLCYQKLYEPIAYFDSMEGRAAYITDENGIIVCALEKEKIGIRASMMPKNTDLVRILISEVEESRMLNNGWNLYIKSDNLELLFSLLRNLKDSALLALFIVLISVVYAYRSSGYIVKPLQIITKQLKKAEVKAVFTKVSTKSELEEILVLECSYNQMLDRLDDLIQKNAIIRNEAVYAKLLALQTQISPHFLANSFELIRGIAIKTENVEIEKITEALSMMYRYILNESDKVVTLAEEIEYVKNYIKIQEYRFGKQVEVFFYLPKELEKCKVLCLSVQPLVENAYRHGFDNENPSKILLIECIDNGDTLEVIVKDNGAGMSEERIREVRKELEKPIQMNAIRTESDYLAVNGIGLKNVNDRLLLFFGGGSGLNIESEPGKGTKISFCIRKEKEYEGTDH